MAMGRRDQQGQQEKFWIAHTELPRTVSHPFYEQVNRLLEKHAFERFVEGECSRYYAEKMGRPSLVLVERSFAHAYETGGMRRLHLRGRENIFKRLLIHLCGFNLSLVMRQHTGKGTPRGWQGFSADACLLLLRVWTAVLAQMMVERQASPAETTE